MSAYQQNIGLGQLFNSGTGAEPAGTRIIFELGCRVLVTDSKPYRVGKIIDIAKRYTKEIADYALIEWEGTGFFGAKLHDEWHYTGELALIEEGK